MKKNVVTTALGGLAILLAVAALACALRGGWSANEPFPVLLYRTVSPALVTATFAVAGLLGLASGGLLLAGNALGAQLMIAGLAWDLLCQLAGLAGGRLHCVLWIGLDAALIAALLSSARARD